MAAPEYFQCFARGTHTALLHVFQALADAFLFVCLRGDIEQSLIGFGILHDDFGLSVDGKDERFFRLFEMLRELRRIAAELSHGLKISFYIEHEDLARQWWHL
jgi:hypothetical protein